MTLQRVAQSGESRSQSSRRTSSTTTASSAGLISGYRIISLKPDGRSGIQATLDVDVPVYRVDHVQANRKRIAVYPVETPRARYEVGGTSLSGQEASQRLTQSVVSMLVQSRRFSVLDRDMREAIEREHGFLGRTDVPMREKLAVGHTLGADLLLVTRLRELETSTTRHHDNFTGEIRETSSGAAVLEARVVMPSTGQLMWSRTVNLGASDFSRPMRVQNALDTLGRELVQGLLEGIYPLRVVDGLGYTAVINQGGDMLQLGQRFEVFEIGRRIQDPYNGEGLGAREQRVATVEITFVGAKTSRVRVVDGTVNGDGHVLRRMPSMAAGLPSNQRGYQSDSRYQPDQPARRKVCFRGDSC